MLDQHAETTAQLEPKVTLLLPVYKTEPWLPACLESVLAQTLKELEIICVDDASPLGALEMLQDYARRDPRIRVIHLEQNLMQGNARNIGIDQARGKYLYFLDSDDMIEPTAMQELYELAERDQLDLAFCDLRDIFDDVSFRANYTSPISTRHGSYDDHVLTGIELIDELVTTNQYSCQLGTMLWRTEFLREEGIRNELDTWHEDELFSFRAHLAARRTRHLARQLYIRRLREGSVMTSGMQARNLRGYLKIFQFMTQFVVERNIHEPAAEQIISHIYGEAKTIYQNLAAHEDLRAFFREAGDELMYDRFLCTLGMGEWFYRLDERTVELARSHGSVYVYGAGEIARRFARALTSLDDILIRGFVVSDPSKNPPVVQGRPVVGLEGFVPEDDAIVLVAVSRRFLPEVAADLDARAIPWAYYRSDEPSQV